MCVCVSVELRCYINPSTPCHTTPHCTISFAILTTIQTSFLFFLSHFLIMDKIHSHRQVAVIKHSLFDQVYMFMFSNVNQTYICYSVLAYTLLVTKKGLIWIAEWGPNDCRDIWMSSLSNWKNCRTMLILTLLRKLLLFTTVILLGLSQTWTTHCNLLNQPRHTLSLTDFIGFCMFSASVLFILSKYVGFIHDRERNPLDFNKLDTIMHHFKGSRLR